MAEDPTDILTEAIARNSATVLSLPSAGMLRHHKSRFLSETPDGVWMQSVPADQVLIDQLIEIGQPCAVSFKAGEQKINFASKLIRTQAEFRLNAETIVPAILLARPAQVKAVQRRMSYRVPITPATELRCKLWRINEQASLKDKPMKATALGVTMKDLSVGGLGVTLIPLDGNPPLVQPNERLRVSLQYQEEDEMLMEGRVRAPHAGKTPGTIDCGIQFCGMQDGLEGRQTLSELTKVIGTLHLIEVRRARMGMTGA